jgi:hypothetical protein
MGGLGDAQAGCIDGDQDHAVLRANDGFQEVRDLPRG